MADPPFIHLCVHSEYSLVDGVVRIKPLVKAVAAAGMPAVAVTDQGNLFALVKFYRAARAAGVKPILGVDAMIRDEGDSTSSFRMLLLVQNSQGYRNLTRLGESRTARQRQNRSAQHSKFLHHESLIGNATPRVAALHRAGEPRPVRKVLCSGQANLASRECHLRNCFPRTANKPPKTAWRHAARHGGTMARASRPPGRPPRRMPMLPPVSRQHSLTTDKCFQPP